MNDYTQIKENEGGEDFEITREIKENVPKENLEGQLEKLEHQLEGLEAQQDALQRRINLIEQALEEGEAEGDTTIVNVRPNGDGVL